MRLVGPNTHGRHTKGPLLSLFCGAGGLDLGFEQAGYSIELALDVDPVAVRTHNFNRTRPSARICDLSRESPGTMVSWWQEQADGIAPIGIIGGPPCQAFSVSNVHRFESDPRAVLPLAYADILATFHRKFALRFFLFENVAGLGNPPHADSLELFMERFQQAGFPYVIRFYLDAVDFGVAQRRRRMFIAGFDVAAAAAEFSPPRGDPSRRLTVRDLISGLPEPVLHGAGRHPADVGLHPNHWAMAPRSPKFRNGSLRPGQMLGRSFRTLDWDQPSWTVAYGHREVHVHPSTTRRLSVYEALRLQGFPGVYQLQGTLSDQIRLVSDAVPPPLAKALASTIAAYLGLACKGSEETHHVDNGHTRQSGRVGVHTRAPRSTKPRTVSS